MLRTVVWPMAGPGTQAAMAKAAELLYGHRATVEGPSLPPDLDELPVWHRAVMTADSRSAFFPEYSIAKDRLSQYLADLVGNAARIARRQQMDGFNSLAAAWPRVDKTLSACDAVIVPSVHDEAPVGLESTASAAFNVIWTLVLQLCEEVGRIFESDKEWASSL